MDGFFNPWLMTGMGILSGNRGATGNVAFSNAMAGGMQGMQQAQQMAAMQQMQQTEALRQQALMREAELEQRRMALPDILSGNYTPEGKRAAALAAYPRLVVESMLQTPKTSNAMTVYGEAGGQAGTGKPFARWYAEDYKGGGTNINVGGAGAQFGAVPSGMTRIPDPSSPTGSRLVTEPGSPQERKQEIAQAKLIAPLDSLEDSLKMYRQVLQEYGPEKMMGEGRTRVDEAYTDLLLKQKEAADLGAITGPDMELMQRMMIDPTSWTAQIYEKTGKTDAIFAQLDQIQRRIDTARARAKGEEPPETPRRQRAEAQSPAPPQIGEVQQGYRYIGGNPGDPANWERVK